MLEAFCFLGKKRRVHRSEETLFRGKRTQEQFALSVDSVMKAHRHGSTNYWSSSHILLYVIQHNYLFLDLPRVSVSE